MGPGTVTLTAAHRERKPWSWGWKVVSCVLLEKLSERAVKQKFAADGMTISRDYIRACMADYHKYFNPNHRTDTTSKFMEASLAADQQKFIYDLFVKDPELYFDEVAAKFQRT